MATSGTYTFSPEIAEICDEAFERCGIDPASLIHKHVISARRSLSYVFTTWATRGIHLWTVAQTTETLVSSTASYSAPTGCIALLDVAVRDSSGNDYALTPLGREGYFAISDKDQEGVPTSFWYERVLTPKIWTWPVINTTGYTLVYNYMHQLQDPGAASNTLGIPDIWQEAIVSALAAKLAEKYSPEREQGLLAKAEARYREANGEDRERHETVIPILKYRRR